MKHNDEKYKKCTTQNYCKLSICMIAGVASLGLSFLICFINPAHIMSKHVLRLTEGSYLYEILHEEIPCVYLHIYLFNITNGAAFLAGKDTKLRVEEVGPFTYQEFRKNEDIELDEENGLMKYSPKFRLEFLREKSIADPKDVILQLPNIPMLTLATRLSTNPFTQYGYNLLIAKMNTKAILSLDAHSYLWGWDDPIVKMFNSFIPGIINFSKLGLLDRLYENERSRIELATKEQDKFKIRKYNGEAGLSMHGYGTEKQSRCNTFEDVYEGLGYPTDLTKETPLRIFRYSFCRILDLQYQGSRTMKNGAEAFVYKFSNETFTMNENNKCVCTLPTCIEGVSNIGPCFYDTSTGLSIGHYLHSDPKLYERLEGIKPNAAEHDSEFVIDSKLGVVLSTRFSLQGNVIVGDVRFNSATRQFSNMVVPTILFKIVQPDLIPYVKKILWFEYSLGPYLRIVPATLSFVAGLLLLAIAVRSCLCLRAKSGLTYKLSTTVPLIDEKNGDLAKTSTDQCR
ncbi:lysosome membrane protein 2-like [Zerene cesonia]|uniref:lysosome membrane protein 2-like n=1 Tax=Zerene cesonia TaxID=33412 RepID=UPI0018E52436|nr:lysosome membrane protein 2-like [Zerene cesonia]